MLTNFFITIYYLFITLYSVVPNWSLPDVWIEYFTTAYGYALAFNGLWPVFEFLEVLKYILYFHLLIIAVRTLVSGFNWIRGSGEMKIE